MHPMINRILPVLLVVCLCSLIGFFSGCARKQALPLGYSQKISSALYLPEDLEKKLIQYWSYRSAGQLENAWEMEAPYIRELTPVHMYSKILANPPSLTNIQIVNVRNVTNYFYEVTLQMFSEKNGGEVKAGSLVDKWVRVNDTWTHVIRDPVFKDYFP